jgi:hypothetical protein
MPNSDECTILTGLLDFYSDRATAHASFVVAATFGIYTLLFSVDVIGIKSNWQAFGLFLAAYLPLLSLDIYSFFNFAEYASLAHIIQKRLVEKQYPSYDDWTEEMRQQLKTYRAAYFFLSFKRNKIFRAVKTFVFIVGIFLTAILPAIFVYIYMWT